MKKPLKRKKYQVVFQPSGRKGEVSGGQTVIEASRELGIEIESLCGGVRNCGKCKIKLVEGHLSPFTDEEAKFIADAERLEGVRLACSAQIKGNVIIYIPEENLGKRQVVRKDLRERPPEVKPAITLHYLELSPPTLQDPLGDFDRLQEALSEKYHLPSLDIDYPALLGLQHLLREGDWKATAAVWMGREIIEIIPGKVDKAYGLAVDIGTTTIAGYLCNLTSGEVIATESMMNPQVIYGEDVMSRITYAVTHPDGLEELHRSIISGLNRLIAAVTGRCHLSSDHISELVMVGNTAMHHLFLQIYPKFLGISPFPPATHRSINVKARDLGLKAHPSGNVHVLPIEAGFVGADNVGVLIAEEPHRQDEMVLIIDIGTNGELVMGNRKKLISASCATGPALEGAHIKFGMRAASGAIERIEIHPETFDVRFEVIGNSRAMGICGSGIIDAASELYRSGVLDKSGRFRNEIKSSRLRAVDETTEFVIAWKNETSIGKDITITQKDVRNIQLAKAALYAGAKLMMRRLGIEKLDKVILAGAFGSYIDPEKALVLGIFPDCDLKNVYAVGNAAGDGARLALLNKDKRAEADEIARNVEYIELSIEADFQKEFIEAMQIPHMEDSFPHLKGLVRDEILNQ
jgi:uncharacterized 2Fe-2S/4Fe-4S cluster protein (DUF4445 family)